MVFLECYAKEGQGFVHHRSDDGMEFQYFFRTAGGNLNAIASAWRWYAIQAACERKLPPESEPLLRAGWQALRLRAAAYSYYGRKIELQSGFAPITHIVATIVDCLLRGWHEQALDLANLTRSAFAQNDDPYAPRLTQWFVLRLLTDWQQEQHTYRPLRFKEPVYNALIEKWRTHDAAEITELLLAACDRHTHHSLFTSGSKSPDLDDAVLWYDPFEINAVLYLRRLEGLENPVLDHLLMQTPLAALPAPAPFADDELLDEVVAKARLEWPKL